MSDSDIWGNEAGIDVIQSTWTVRGAKKGGDLTVHGRNETKTNVRATSVGWSSVRPSFARHPNVGVRNPDGCGANNLGPTPSPSAPPPPSN